MNSMKLEYSQMWLKGILDSQHILLSSIPAKTCGLFANAVDCYFWEKLHEQCLRGGHARSLHLELLLGGAKHLNFISPPRPNTSVYLIPYFQSPFIRGVIIIMGLWYSNILHHLWCCIPSCYTRRSTEAGS